MHAGAVVVDVEPVPLVEAVAVERERLPVEQVGGEQRDRLLGVLVRPEVVGAPGDDHGQAVGVVVREGDQVRARLRRRVRRAGLERIGLLRRARPRPSRTPRRCRCARTRSTSSRRAVSITTLVPKQFVLMKSSGPAIDRSTWLSAAKCTTASWPRHRRLERAGIADVALDEASSAGSSLDVPERRQVPGVGEGVVDGDLVVGVGQHVAHVVRADEAGAAGDEDPHRRSPWWGRRSTGDGVAARGWPGRGPTGSGR